MTSCLICHATLDPKDAGNSKPFCSERCRMIDLSRWLGEEYGVPWAADSESDELEEEARDGEPRGDTSDSPSQSH